MGPVRLLACAWWSLSASAPGRIAPWLAESVVDRGRHALELDIRTEQGRATCLDALSRADALIEGFWPGVME